MSHLHSYDVHVTGPGDEAKTGPALHAEMLISLTAPKLCAHYFKGKYHVLGGRFVPE